MKFPATSTELKASGYEFNGEAICKGCKESIEFWITPQGRKMPMTVKNNSTVRVAALDMREPHFATCSHADEFRRKR